MTDSTRYRKDVPWMEIPENCGRGRLPKPPEPVADDLAAVFARSLYMPDPEPVYVVAGAIAANMLAGDPVWLVLVAPPSSGKTELLRPTVGVPDCHELDDVTEAGLLSGSLPSRNRPATGGTLERFRTDDQGRVFGILVCQDLSSVLAHIERPDSPLVGALRHVFDGSYTRDLGTQGGVKLIWKGKAGFLGAVTEDIDLHMNTLDAMGPRFIYYRLPDPPDEDEMLTVASANRTRRDEIRAEMAAAVETFFRWRPIVAPSVDPADDARIKCLARFVSRARSVVHRDGWRQIEMVPRPERGARLLGELSQLHAGMLAIGVAPPAAFAAVRKVALDSMTRRRYRVLANLAERDRPATRNVADNLRLPAATVERDLEDLAAHDLIDRSSGGPLGDVWQMTPWAAEQWKAITGMAPPRPPEPEPEPEAGFGPEAADRSQWF